MSNSGKTNTFLVGVIGVFTMLVLAGLTSYLTHQQEEVDADINFDSMYKSDGDLKVTMTNTGEKANMSMYRMKYKISTSQPLNRTELSARIPEMASERQSDCFANKTQIWKNGETHTCHTGIEFPDPGTELTLIVDFKNDTAQWSKECKPKTSSSVGC